MNVRKSLKNHQEDFFFLHSTEHLNIKETTKEPFLQKKEGSKNT